MSTSGSSRDLKIARKVVLKHLHPYRARVYLFGSHATGMANPFSDIDVAIQPLEPIPALTIMKIKDELEESDILRQVDVVNLDETDKSFRQRVEREGIVWKE